MRLGCILRPLDLLWSGVTPLRRQRKQNTGALPRTMCRSLVNELLPLLLLLLLLLLPVY
jgi:hypothetical protein